MGLVKIHILNGRMARPRASCNEDWANVPQALINEKVSESAEEGDGQMTGE